MTVNDANDLTEFTVSAKRSRFCARHLLDRAEGEDIYTFRSNIWLALPYDLENCGLRT